MKRYEIVATAWKEENSDGEFVRFEDAQAEINQLNKACDQRAAHEYKLMAEIDALKAERDELLAENKRLKFQADVIDALNDVAYCNGYQFGAQEMCAKYRKEADESIDRRRTTAKEAIAKARGESV